MKSVLPIHDALRTPELIRYPQYEAWWKVGAYGLAQATFAEAMKQQVSAPDRLWQSREVEAYMYGRLTSREEINPEDVATRCNMTGEQYPMVMANLVGGRDGEVIAYLAWYLGNRRGHWGALSSTMFSYWLRDITNLLYSLKLYWLGPEGQEGDKSRREAQAFMELIANWSLLPAPNRKRPLHLDYVESVELIDQLVHERARAQLWDALESVGATGSAHILFGGSRESGTVKFDTRVGMAVVGDIYDRVKAASWMKPFTRFDIEQRFEDIERSLYRCYDSLVTAARGQ